MGAEVYANAEEIACKAGDGKVIASFPDVCLSPPSPPAGPVPVPYPNTSFSKDMQNGSKTVKIKGKEVMLKDQSFYKTAPLGDEAATQGLGANVITHVITGKTYFAAWSMDVTFEGENVDRHCDLTTSNHASYPAGCAVPNPNLAMIALAEERIKQDLCPCCGQSIADCPAAFAPGEGARLKKEGKLMGFGEYYKILPLCEPPTDRQIEMEALYDMKDNCTCPPGNEVFPSPPCDVHRANDDPKRTKRISDQWSDGYSDTYRKNNTLKDAAHFRNEILSGNPALAALHAIAGSLRKGDPRLKEYREKVTVPADKKARVNHRTPKEAGGCPGHPGHDGNLQPQQNLCENCQNIDNWMTDHWQG
jgi:hypothetical protein